MIEATEPGQSIDLKDILTCRHFHVLEQSASRTLRPGDVTFTRVVTAGGASIMMGASAWVIPPQWHLRIIEFREELCEQRMLTRDDLSDFDFEIRELYHAIVAAILNPPLPVLQNTDGDPLEPVMLTYALSVSATDAFERLRPLATLEGDEYIGDETYDEGGVLTGVVLTWTKAGNRKHAEWNNTSLGALRLDGSQLIVEVNSDRRRQQIEKEIAKRLGPAATLLEATVIDVAKELEEARAQKGSKGLAQGPTLPEFPRTPEIEAIEKQLAQKHWDAWVDVRLPALGNKTPRQAATSPQYRERLEALLADFARTAERSPATFAPDVNALRRRLGLES